MQNIDILLQSQRKAANGHKLLQFLSGQCKNGRQVWMRSAQLVVIPLSETFRTTLKEKRPIALIV